MLIGIMSDSHGKAEPLRRAFDLLDARGCEAFFHCGDVGGPDVLEQFAGRRIWFVWGNTDWPDAGTRAFLKTIGVPDPAAPVRVELAGKRIVLCHGHERAFRVLSESPDSDYLFYGHTHAKSDVRLNGCRLINPGALHRAKPRTVATLDLAQDVLTCLEIS